MELEELKEQIAALRAQLGITEADDIGDSIDELIEARDELQQRIDDEADADAMREAMAVTAAKLYAGISIPSGDPASPGSSDRAAAYNTGDDAILVSIGDGANAPTPVELSEDEDMKVATNRGWEGTRCADPAGDDMPMCLQGRGCASQRGCGSCALRCSAPSMLSAGSWKPDSRLRKARRREVGKSDKASGGSSGMPQANTVPSGKG